MTQPFIGEIRQFAFDFPPRGWASCAGQILPINQNQALFALLGTTYGGNGVTTFQLPDLRGRVPIHWGNGPGLSPIALGQRAGEENHTLLLTELPVHTHTFAATTTTGNKPNVNGSIFADDVDTQAVDYFASPTAPNSSLVPLHPLSMPAAGGSQPHNNMQPTLVVNISIALQGLFPSRN